MKTAFNTTRRHNTIIILYEQPENIVIDTEGNVSISGYGLGRNIGREGPVLHYTDGEYRVGEGAYIHQFNYILNQKRNFPCSPVQLQLQCNLKS